AEPTKGTISGKVTNESGQPMAGATAFVRAVNSGSGRTTSTDADGNFQVNNLEPALYIVNANAPAYTSVPSDPSAPTYYRIGDSVNLQLMRGGVITGTVTNSLGEPLVAVRVRAAMTRDTKGKPTRLPYVYFTEQSTDDRGIYRIYGLAPGTYVVSAGGYGSQAFQFNPYDSDVPTYAPSSTRDDAAEVNVSAGEETNADIRYRGEQGHTISGTVKVAGTNGSSVSLLPAGSVILPTTNTFQAPGARGFAFNGVSDGEYVLIAEEFAQTGTPTPMMTVSEPKRVIVKGANVSGVELIPMPLALISGRLVLQASKLTECEGKRPPLMSETLVQLKRPEVDPEKDGPALRRNYGTSASPDANGAFTLRNVSPGKYQFEPRFYARYWYLQSITLGAAAPASGPRSQTSRASDAAATWTNVKSGDQLNNLTITLVEGAASIRGKTTVADPPVSATLFLVPAEPEKADDVLRFFVTEIAVDGTFALNNLPPGRYWVLIQTNTDAQLAKLAKLREPEAATARTKLRRSAETQKTEIELKPCQNLTDYQLKR
ncbi:MAG TPA: carboxypeptidase-like regulatory domain-containing protein, partial [Pyrinomonadaceae bacterium]